MVQTTGYIIDFWRRKHVFKNFLILLFLVLQLGKYFKKVILEDFFYRRSNVTVLKESITWNKTEKFLLRLLQLI